MNKYHAGGYKLQLKMISSANTKLLSDKNKAVANLENKIRKLQNSIVHPKLLNELAKLHSDKVTLEEKVASADMELKLLVQAPRL